jgi:hypothetical protein
VAAGRDARNGAPGLGSGHSGGLNCGRRI